MPQSHTNKKNEALPHILIQIPSLFPSNFRFYPRQSAVYTKTNIILKQIFQPIP